MQTGVAQSVHGWSVMLSRATDCDLKAPNLAEKDMVRFTMMGTSWRSTCKVSPSQPPPPPLRSTGRDARLDQMLPTPSTSTTSSAEEEEEEEEIA